MKIAVRIGKAATMIALALPVVATAQYTGVSHPDDTPIMNNPDSGAQVYTPKKALVLPQPELKPNPSARIGQTLAHGQAQKSNPSLDQLGGLLPSAPRERHHANPPAAMPQPVGELHHLPLSAGDPVDAGNHHRNVIQSRRSFESTPPRECVRSRGNGPSRIIASIRAS